MATFILKSFLIQDEEIQVVHLPVVFVAITEFLNVNAPFFLRRIYTGLTEHIGPLAT